MDIPEKDEIVSLVLALEEVASDTSMKGGGLRFMCKEAARLIRRLRPDLAFKEENLKKRPVMFRVMDDNVWRVFSDEKEASDFADKIGMSYHGLYVRDGT